MHVRLYATLRQIVGKKVVEIPALVEQSVGDILRALVQLHPRLEDSIWYPDGTLAEHVAVILNGRDIRHLDGIHTPLSDEDSMDVFPPVGGGSSQNGLTRVTLKLTSHFRARTGLFKTDFEFKGNTLREFIPALLGQYDIDDLLMEDGELRFNVRVVINGRYSSLLGGFDAPIQDGATIVLTFAWGGRYTTH